MIALVALALAAAPIDVAAGEHWAFAIERGHPVRAHRLAPGSGPAKGEIGVRVSPMMGTTMTIINRAATGFTYRATLILPDGTTAAARSCTLLADGKPAIESWTAKARAVRLSDFKPASGGNCR